MFKKILLISLLVIFGATCVYAASGRESTQNPPQEVVIKYNTESYMWQGKDINGNVTYMIRPNGDIVGFDTSGQTRFWQSVTGEQYKYDASGNLEDYKAADSIQVVQYADLTTLTSQAATAGDSVYQASPGVTYLIDIMEISNHYSTNVDTGFTGVTIMAPQATAVNDGKTFTVIWHIGSGATVYDDDHSGATVINVVGYNYYASTGTAGATCYHGAGHEAESVYEVTGHDVTSGGSNCFINKPGEFITVRLQYNSRVSDFPIDWKDY